MQKGAIKAVVLTVIFFVAVGVFSMMTNHVNEDLTTELRDMRTPEEIAESERLAKLPPAEELQKNTIEIVVLDLLTEAGVL